MTNETPIEYVEEPMGIGVIAHERDTEVEDEDGYEPAPENEEH